MNGLYRFFFEEADGDTEQADVYELVQNAVQSDRLHLDAEQTKTLRRYLGRTGRAIRETVAELVRLQEFPDRPSRLSCIFAAETFEEAMQWKTIFASFGRDVLQIVELSVQGNVFRGDASLLPGVDSKPFAAKIEQARAYWKGTPDPKLPELLVEGRVVVQGVVQG